MDSSKTEKREIAGESKAPKKRSRLKRLVIWLFIDLTVVAAVIILLLYRPGRYDPLSDAGFKPGQVSPYLTLFTASVYNGVQLKEPFDVNVSEEEINDIIAHGGLDWDWPLENDGVMLYAPAAVLEPGMVVLMGTANIRGMEFVVTIKLEPIIDENGLLNLTVGKLKIGAMNITPIAKMMAKKMYAEQVADVPMDEDSWQTKIVASLLNDEPFEPVFPTGDEKVRVRVEKVDIKKGEIRIRLIPHQVRNDNS
jgi:hypothetical protein